TSNSLVYSPAFGLPSSPLRHFATSPPPPFLDLRVACHWEPLLMRCHQNPAM
ncbi:hypothetical protein CPB84DRAFT_1784187, partial [Gymnopilus junonius]